jgi:predicted ATPase
MFESKPDLGSSQKLGQIKSINLQNWKSVESAHLECGALTLLVGQNSVGKSSAIQSILAILQWLRNGSSVDFPLNGELVKLGKFRDTATVYLNSSIPDAQKIGFELVTDQYDFGVKLVQGRRLGSGAIEGLQFSKGKNSCSITFRQQACQFKAEFAQQHISQYSKNASYAAQEVIFGDYTYYQEYTGWPSELSLVKQLNSIQGVVDVSLIELIEEKLRTLAAVLLNVSKVSTRTPKFVSLEDFLDQKLFLESEDIVDVRDGLEKLIYPYISKTCFAYFYSHQDKLDLLALSGQKQSRLERITKNADDLLAQNIFPDLGIEMRTSVDVFYDTDISLQSWVRDEIEAYLKRRHIGKFESENIEIDDEGNAYLEEKWDSPIYKVNSKLVEIPWLSQQLWDLDFSLSHEDLDGGIDSWDHLSTPSDILLDDLTSFGNRMLDSVSYLGPLRVDGFKSAVYESTRNPNMPVGPSGENTASLIYELLLEEETKPFPKFGAGIVECTFKEALESWFGLYTVPQGNLEVIDMDKVGLQVTVSGRSLDRFGTGASQVLPILALLLSRESGDVVLIEQPELHLHPGGQQYLADLFMEISKLGVQVIIETHSEYMVNRIRRGIVLGFQEADLVRIVNFDQNERGLAEATSVKMTGSGGFADWPRGFFAQTEEDLLAIIEALEGTD